ncbi:hypothetical protein CRM22_010742 [Opisthorchis felineus]|uniref:Uncharacterized protein n=1 Tax=Opisthorchis felineus TaxID=147828 RepID=A0A4V3SB48_OPIFE|nr:hypothetical protein CRM22_010742 [Opisthorchis felineus]TGZ51515.1 hypothetical protein CRM22_010742 [Opisthorchis felineus]
MAQFVWCQVVNRWKILTNLCGVGSGLASTEDYLAPVYMTCGSDTTVAEDLKAFQFDCSQRPHLNAYVYKDGLNEMLERHYPSETGFYTIDSCTLGVLKSRLCAVWTL